MRTAEPKIIYLQIGEDANIEDMKSYEFETNAITWCWDKINDNDVKYISANGIISKIDEMIGEYKKDQKELINYGNDGIIIDYQIIALTELKQFIEGIK